MFAHSSSPSSFLCSSPEFNNDKFVSFNTITTSPPPPCVRFRSPRFTASAASSSSSAETTSRSQYLRSNMTSSSSLYEVLGISMGATGDEIKSAYRKLARTCHPDVVTIDRKDTSADAFIKIHAAYSTLSDPGKRADYDRNLFRQQYSFNSPFSTSTSTYKKSTMSGFSGYTCRNWETDQCW